MCTALWYKIRSGDRPLPTVFLDACSAQEYAPVSLSAHQNLGASEAEFSSKKGSRLLRALQAKMGVGDQFPINRYEDQRANSAQELRLCTQLHQPPGTLPGSKEKSCPYGEPGLEGPKIPCPPALWKPERSSLLSVFC